MSSCLCCSPLRLSISTRYELSFPWILYNPNPKSSPILLSLHHSNPWPRISPARVLQQGGDLVVSPEEVFPRISEVKNPNEVVEEVSDVGIEDNVPISSSTRATKKIGGGEASDARFKVGNRKKVYVKKGTVKKARIATETRHRVSDSYLDNLCKNGHLKEAVEALESLAGSGSKVSSVTYMNLLQSCVGLNSVELGRKLHALKSLVKDVDTFVETKLVSMYAKCGYLHDARKVFDGMSERNLFTWSAMIGAYSRAQKWDHVLKLFVMMVKDGVIPDRFLFPKILEACGNRKNLEATKAIHSMVVRRGYCGSVRVSNSILGVYAKSGKLNWAKRFFDQMETRDAVSWNSIITGFFHKGLIEEANRLFGKMREEGIEPGLVTWNIMITSYNQVGESDVAMELMKKMESLGIAPDVYTWTSMISGFSHNNRRHQALDLFKAMLLEGVEPNAVTVTSVVSACASLRSIGKGKEIHAFSIKIGLMDNVLVGNSHIDMYCKCGDLEAAQEVFDAMVERDVYTWNSLIGGYCQAGFCGKACELFTKMQELGVAPNVVTWNVMISGYIQNGHEDPATDLFQRMEKDGKIKRSTASWNTLMAGYLQLGEKDKAFRIFRQMQFNWVVPNMVTVLSILPACGDLVAAKKVREMHCCVLRRSLESELPVLNSLVDTYAKSGNLRYSKILFDRMQSKDIITWNSILAGYVSHGFPDLAIGVYDHMRKSRLKPNRGTFLYAIHAYALSGLVDDGIEAFASMLEDDHIVPGPEHYSAMVDLFGRAGRLGEAVELVANMPVEPDFSVWSALLTASRIHRNVSLAIRALDNMLALEPWKYVVERLRTQIDGLVGKSEIDYRMKKLEKENATEIRQLSRCWIELENTVYSFHAGDQSHPYLYPWIHNVTGKGMSQSGFHDGLCIEEEDKEEVSGVHSEKLALGFALIGFPRKSQCIRIVKSLRMCANCHETVKRVSKLYDREIFVNDSKCLHRFSDGQCSCRDYW